MLAAVGCGKNDVLIDQPSQRQTIEFIDIKENPISPKQKNLSDTIITCYVDVVLKYNKGEYNGLLGVLSSPDPKIDRVAVLGVDSLIYGYADVIEISPKVYEASYYLLDGQQYMKATLTGNKIQITETYFDSLVGVKRPRGWLGRFVGCVERFAHTVTSDPEWGAFYVVGAIYAPHYVLAGLGIGCAIDASL